jgi:hypothetical protein
MDRSGGFCISRNFSRQTLLVLMDFVVCGRWLALERILARNEHEYSRIEARKWQPNDLSERK